MKLFEYKKIIAEKLSVISSSPQLDAELLIMHTCKLSRTELLIRSDETLAEKNQQQIDQFVTRRVNAEPIAYLLGHQPFWTMDLIVTHNTFIPRPETECLIEWVLKKFPEKNLQVADLGTGTGAIAIALALENKNWEIDAIDQSSKALCIAKKNAEKQGTNNIIFYESNWYDALPQKKYDVIISNPPYIAENDLHLEKLTCEPSMALIAGKNGLDAIEKIVAQAKNFLKQNGYLVVEHGFDQAKMVFKFLENAEFTDIKNHHDLSNVPRFVTGKVTVNR